MLIDSQAEQEADDTACHAQQRQGEFVFLLSKDEPDASKEHKSDDPEEYGQGDTARHDSYLEIGAVGIMKGKVVKNVLKSIGKHSPEISGLAKTDSEEGMICDRVPEGKFPDRKPAHCVLTRLFFE